MLYNAINIEKIFDKKKTSGGLLSKKSKIYCVKLPNHIYLSKDVLDIELAGYRIIGFLLEKLTDAIQNPSHTYSRLLLGRVPEQYEPEPDDLYSKVQSIIDYVSGMTDIYALDLYRKITGMGLPAI